VRPGQPGFEDDEPADAGGDESVVRPGQPGFEDDGAEDAAADEQSPVQVGQPGFEEDTLDELPGEDEPVDGDPVAEQSPFPLGQPGFDPVPEDAGFVFQPTDMSCWCTPGIPEEWQEWTPPVTPAPDSWTAEGYSTDWGVVEPEWAVGGQDPLTVTEPERPLSGVFGPGHALDVHWADQGDTQYCGLYSVRTILSELGRPVDMDEMAERAAANGWFVYDEAGEVKGIRPRDIDDILASYGVGSHQFGGPEAEPVADRDAWQALNTALANNQRVVIGVDGREFTESRDVDTPGRQWDMDHFVAVSAVDYDRGVVIVNDSARGAGLEIPLDVFFNSWRDSNFSLTITDTSMPGDGTAQPPAETVPAPEGPGISIIGTTLQPQPGEPVEDPQRGETVVAEDPFGPAPTPEPGLQGTVPEQPEPQGRPGAPEAPPIHVAPGQQAIAPEPAGSPAPVAFSGAVEQPGDGFVHPTAPLLADLSPGIVDSDELTKAEKLDLGMADELRERGTPGDEADDDPFYEDAFEKVMELVGSIDDAIADVAKWIASQATQVRL
jgi:hypothetical protein